jgi:hypothetical protein
VTVKVSIAGLSLAAVLLATAAWYLGERPGRSTAISTVAKVSALGALAVVVWMGRNVVLTGCPFYLSQFAAVPVEWRVSANMVEQIWPQRIDDLRVMFLDPHWFLRRLEGLGWTEPEVLSALRLAAAAAVVGVLVRLIRWGQPSPQRLSAFVLLPTVVSFVVCFLVAPVPRYFGATLWLLAVQTIIIGVGDLVAARRWTRAAVVAMIVAAVCLQLRAAPEPLRRLSDFEPFSHTPVQTVRLPSGLVVHVPVEHDTCWDAPLPCTPEPNRGLRLRREGDLSSGFVIDPSVP